MKKLCCGIVVLITGWFLYGQSVLKQGDGTLLLENEFIKACISPDEGARVLQLIDKRNGYNYTSPYKDDGIGGELNWQGNELTANSPWYGKPYIYTIDQSRKGEISIAFQRNGSSFPGNMKWITIYKTYRLTRDSSTLQLDYRIAVDHDAMNNVTFCLWSHSTSQVRDIPGTIYFPTVAGVKQIPYNSASPANESFIYDLTGGWAALGLDQANAGIAYCGDYRDLMCFYNWQGATVNSMEFMYRSQSIPYGKSFNTTITYTLYTGLPKVDGAGNGWVGAFIGKDNEITGSRIYCSAKGKATLKLSSRKCPARLEQPVAEIPVSGQGGQVSENAFSFRPTEAGTYELIGRLIDEQGDILMTMSVPVVVGQETAPYARIQEGPPEGTSTSVTGLLSVLKVNSKIVMNGIWMHR